MANWKKFLRRSSLLLMLLLVIFSVAYADGTESLEPPSVPIASGTGVVAAGTGLETQPGTIDITVPANSTVKQVLLYWVGGTQSASGDDTISVDGHSISGVLIGGPTNFYQDYWFSAYRADITAYGLVQPGSNSLSITGMDFPYTVNNENNGAGLLVIYDDGTAPAEIQLRDGLDLAFIWFAPPLDSTVPQTFTFAPTDFDRLANLAMFFASVADDRFRPTSIEVTIDGNTTTFSNLLGSNDGPQWDTVSLPGDPIFPDIVIPAGTTSLTVQAFSRNDDGGGGEPLPASFGWTASALSVRAPGQIGDTVFVDHNGNGIQDAGDAGIPNVTVNLYSAGPDGVCGTDDDGFITSDVTDANGNYLFEELDAGTYCVDPDETTVPAGYFLTTNNDPQTVPLALGQTYLDADFGYQPPMTLGDRVWYDQNQNGIQDTNEPGYNGISVDLYGNASCSGSPLASTITAAGPAGFGDGHYQFSGLMAGDYCLQFGNIPAGWSISPADQGGDDTVDSDASGSAQIPNISLTADDLNEDMGIYVTGTLGDSVVCASTGQGLADITVSLFKDFDGNGVADGPAIATIETDATGFYQFTGLEVALAGDGNNTTNYIVRVDTSDPNLGTCNIPAGPTEYNPPLDSDNPNDPDNDFAFAQQPGSIGDRVWYDDNGDGVQDNGEGGIPGVTVKLTDCSGNILATDVTDANGWYLFTSLEAGTYCVVIDQTTLPANLTQTFEKDGSLDGDTQQPLAAGEDILDVDFGYQPPRFTLGDRVWYDQNQNGIQDANEPGYNGITVDLYDNASCSGSAIASTTTMAGPAGFGNGYYQFGDLMAGNYCLQFGNIPAGWSISPANQGGDDSVDSDANSAGQITNISLSADDPTRDMGIYVAGILGDSVVCRSTGEGLANITVTLYKDFDGDGVADGPAIATTETDATGFYQFTGLEVALAGDANNITKYIVTVDTNDADLGTCNVPVPPTSYNPPLDSDNPDDPANDFAFELPQATNPGTGTPGYWMNHPDAWPMTSIEIGGQNYTREDAIMYMKARVKKDKTYSMFPALVSAKLNVAIGNDSSCIAAAITAADAWMSIHEVGSGVEASSDAWKAIEPLYLQLDAYNNGLLCAPSRDLFD